MASKPKPKVKVTSLPMVRRKNPILGRPKYSEMIRYAISSLKERSGSSRQAILKFITAFYDVGPDPKVVNNHLKQALRAGVKNGKLKQSKGTGASGSFRLGDGKKKERKSKVKSVSKKPNNKIKKGDKTKKPKKVKRGRPKKETTAKKSVKKQKTTKSAARISKKKPTKAPKQNQKSSFKKIN